MEFNDSRVYISGDVRKDREYVYLLFYRINIVIFKMLVIDLHIYIRR